VCSSDLKAYIEPFCGGMSVLFAKPRVVNERVNDLNGALINLAQVLASEEHWGQLDDWLARTVWSEELHDRCLASRRYFSCDVEDRLLCVERAYATFVLAWMGRGGFSGTPKAQCVSRRNDTGGGWSGSRFRNSCDAIAWMHERLRTVEITNNDGIKISQKLKDQPGTLIFCDPPFIKEGSQYTHSFAMDDHVRLAEALNEKTRSRVVVEYHDHPWLDELYPRDRWRRVPLGRRDQIGNSNGKGEEAGGRKKVSWLLINGDVLGGGS